MDIVWSNRPACVEKGLKTDVQEYVRTDGWKSHQNYITGPRCTYLRQRHCNNDILTGLRYLP